MCVENDRFAIAQLYRVCCEVRWGNDQQTNRPTDQQAHRPTDRPTYSKMESVNVCIWSSSYTFCMEILRWSRPICGITLLISSIFISPKKVSRSIVTVVVLETEHYYGISPKSRPAVFEALSLDRVEWWIWFYGALHTAQCSALDRTWSHSHNKLMLSRQWALLSIKSRTLVIWLGSSASAFFDNRHA